MGISTEERREQRQDLIELAHPLEGVEALQGAVDRPTAPIPGVVEKGNASAQAPQDPASRRPGGAPRRWR